jgi:hypothetical protein
MATRFEMRRDHGSEAHQWACKQISQDQVKWCLWGNPSGSEPIGRISAKPGTEIISSGIFARNINRDRVDVEAEDRLVPEPCGGEAKDAGTSAKIEHLLFPVPTAECGKGTKTSAGGFVIASTESRTRIDQKIKGGRKLPWVVATVQAEALHRDRFNCSKRNRNPIDRGQLCDSESRYRRDR